MSIIITILTALVALEFVYIFYLETLQTTSEATSRVFNMSVETLKNANITTLFKNQGVYNLMIAVGLVFGLIVGRIFTAQYHRCSSIRWPYKPNQHHLETRWTCDCNVHLITCFIVT